MNNFIFKSASRLIKNSPITLAVLMDQLRVVQDQNRHLRQDLVDVKLMLNRLLNNNDLQTTVDKFYKDQPGDPYPDITDSD